MSANIRANLIGEETDMSLVTIATFRDSTGIPRAWGIAADHADAVGTAHIELMEYRNDNPAAQRETFHLETRKVECGGVQQDFSTGGNDREQTI